MTFFYICNFGKIVDTLKIIFSEMLVINASIIEQFSSARDSNPSCSRHAFSPFSNVAVEVLAHTFPSVIIIWLPPLAFQWSYFLSLFLSRSHSGSHTSIIPSVSYIHSFSPVSSVLETLLHSHISKISIFLLECPTFRTVILQISTFANITFILRLRPFAFHTWDPLSLFSNLMSNPVISVWCNVGS